MWGDYWSDKIGVGLLLGWLEWFVKLLVEVIYVFFFCVDYEDLFWLEFVVVNKIFSLCGIFVLFLYFYNFEVLLFNFVIKGFMDCKNVRFLMKLL